MKKLILICGANGVGKSTACRALTERLDKAAYIDSDWCRFIHPFEFTEETVAVIKSNILTMMTNYFGCTIIETVIFQYGFHGVRKRIFDDLIDGLHANGIQFEFCPILLECSEEENICRMMRDHRGAERINHAIQNTRSIYSGYDYPSIDTTHLTVEETVDRILNILAAKWGAV